jgi:hypothetical protein
MTTIRKNAGSILLTMIVTLLIAVAPSIAGMRGGSDRGSGSSMGGSTAGDSDRQDTGSRSGSRMMDQGGALLDIGSMPEITTGGLGSGDMTMDIKPVKYKDGRLEVKYYANTHTVSLGRYVLMELSTLEVDGKIYKPVKADQMRGHHAGGRIIFEVPERPDRFRIVIRDIPQVKERSYDWN